MSMKRNDMTLKHLTVLYWLKLLNDMEMDGAKTLGEKYFLLAVDSIGMEQNEFDDIVTELAEMDFMTEIQNEDNYKLDFTTDGLKVATALEMLEELRALGFKSAKTIYKFMCDHKEDIKHILIAVIPEIVKCGLNL